MVSHHPRNRQILIVTAQTGTAGSNFLMLYKNWISRRACDCDGYALVGILAGVFVIAIVTNPILP